VDYDTSDVDGSGRQYRHKFATALERLEATYLRILRAAILLIATLLVIAAVVLAAYSLYKMSLSPDSITEEPAVVEAAEIIDAKQPPATRPSTGEPAIAPYYQEFYDRFIANYHRLFRNRFEPFRQREDKQLSITEFGDSFIQPAQRLAAIKSGDLDFTTDKADLESLLRVMTAAAEMPLTQERLKRYMNARKVRVCETVKRSRTVMQSGWDRYSTSCSNWYEEPMGCPVTRAVEQPYSVQQCRMEYPPNTQSHSEIFRAFQDKYLTLLHDRRAANVERAAAKRAEIEAGKIAGAASLFTSLQILGGFLVLMFFFLLIAIERHQRRKAQT
jgi:hypothetical protein